MIGVAAISVAQRWALLSDGRTVPITNLFDCRGEETADPAEAVSFVAGSERLWFSAPLADFERPVLH